eukprot:10143799-Alexandrium_andersonii.AAC.1
MSASLVGSEMCIRDRLRSRACRPGGDRGNDGKSFISGRICAMVPMAAVRTGGSACAALPRR